MDQYQKSHFQDQCCCFCKTLGTPSEGCISHQPSRTQGYLRLSSGGWCTKKTKGKSVKKVKHLWNSHLIKLQMSAPCRWQSRCDHTPQLLCTEHNYFSAGDPCMLWGKGVGTSSGSRLWRWPSFRCSGQKRLTETHPAKRKLEFRNIDKMIILRASAPYLDGDDGDF